MNIVRYRGQYTRDCVYCGGCESRSARGMTARSLDPHALACLLDRGWARSGTWLYLPLNGPSCCSQLQVRTLAASFSPSKSMRKTWRSFTRATAGRWTVSCVPARPSSESFALFARYQGAVHGEAPDRAAFVSFLVDSPLSHDTPFVSGASFAAVSPLESVAEIAAAWTPEIGAADELADEDADEDARLGALASLSRYGTYHFEHRLDGRLVMVCVADLLPGYYVSIYCYYDPEIRGLSPGIVSAMYEMRWVQRRASEFSHVLLGYVVPGNTRMAYKLRFRPAELLCPVAHTWEDAARVVATGLAEPGGFASFAADDTVAPVPGLIDAVGDPTAANVFSRAISVFAQGAELDALAESAPLAYVAHRTADVLAAALAILSVAVSASLSSPATPSPCSASSSAPAAGADADADQDTPQGKDQGVGTLWTLPLARRPEPDTLVSWGGQIATLDTYPHKLSRAILAHIAAFNSSIGPALSRKLVYFLYS